MLVVGLGNPGKRYARTPHNVGFRVLDGFVEQAPGTPGVVGEQAQLSWSERFDGEVVVTARGTRELVLLKPLTYMNRSGESVRKAMSFFKVSEESTLVVHDEIDLPLATLKLKRGGGEAGHNGLLSISAELGTRDYSRLRVGVGRPTAGPVADFLLAPLPSADDAVLEGCLGAARDAIDLWAREGIERAMNSVNQRPPGATPLKAGPTN
jgi:PTH1 family peptidyl-tRNA hydrolase